MNNWFLSHWYATSSRFSWFLFILIPFSFLFFLILKLRHFLYRFRILKTHYFSVPIIVVGNITVGGTGKTPLVIYLANFLKQKNYRVGVVLRGYGRMKKTIESVSPSSLYTDVGDEAILIQSQTNCPVVVGKNREAAVQHLLKNFEVDLVISDDGLQHYGMGRDIEIALIDAKRKWGNGYLLPAGPLREPKSRLNTVDYIVLNGDGDLSPFNTFAMKLVPSQHFISIVDMKTTMDKKNLPKEIHAVSGIGNPDRFFDLLRAQGFTVIPHAFPDHYPFRRTDIDFGTNAIVVMTEKDAVKCQTFADGRHYYLRVTAELEPALTDSLLLTLNKE